MTVCIAAHVFSENAIVVASDSMVSTGDMSIETMIKIRGIASHWVVQFAGNDVSVVTPILRQVSKQLVISGKESTEDISNAFIKAMQSQLVSRAENEVLLPLGYTLEQFKTSGLSQLGAENFSRLLFQVQQQELDVKFLISGFDNGEAEIFTVSPPGRVADYSGIGFWAIGSGQTNALGSLFNLEVPAKYAGLEGCLYRIYEAKFNAESAIGVGKDMHVGVLSANGERFTLPGTKTGEIREFWQKTRTTVPPQKTTDFIKELIVEAKAEKEKKTKSKQQSASQTSSDQQ